MFASWAWFVVTWLGVTWVGLCDGYRTGAPTSDHVCKEMFPEGHHYDGQLDKPPFEILLSSNVYSRTMEKITVTINATNGYFFKGLFVQARRADCSHPGSKIGLGVFRLIPGEEYLQTVACNQHEDSAVTHSYNTTVVSSEFDWYSPGTMEGHIYFVATIVKDMDNFWTSVTSDILRQSGLETPFQTCPMKTYIDYPNKNPAPKPTPTPPSTQQPTQPGTTEMSQKRGVASSVVVNAFCVYAVGVISASSSRLL